jgi:hypothetical protein
MQTVQIGPRIYANYEKMYQAEYLTGEKKLAPDPRKAPERYYEIVEDQEPCWLTRWLK